MKFFLSFILFFALYIQSNYAQRPDLLTLPNGKARVMGRVIDASNKAPIEFATVKLLDQANKIIDGMATNENGGFMLVVNYGVYILEVEFIGYKKQTSEKFTLDASNTEKMMRGIALQVSQKQLNEVEITAQKDIVENKIDRKVYNVSKDLTASSGTAATVLQNVPSVNFDSDGNLTMRGGSNVTILINGRVTTLNGSDKQSLLNQIQANEIEKIEVITNPSASFDVEGTNGIINIVLKKTVKPGTTGNISLGAGTRQETNSIKVNKYTGSASLNYKNKWVDYIVSANYARRPTFGYGNVERTTYLSGGRELNMSQYNTAENLANNLGIRTSAEFFIDTKNTLFVGGNVNRNKANNLDYNVYNFTNENELILSNETRESTTSSGNLNFGVNAQYKHEFKSSDHQLVFDFNYDQLNQQTINNIDIKGVANLLGTNIDNKFNANLFVGQLNYTQLFNSKLKLETGLKSTNRDFNSSITGENNLGLGFVKDSILSNSLINTDQNYAGYINVSGDLTYFKYMLGLREEIVLLDIETQQGEPFAYKIASLFPSLFLTKELKDKSVLGLSFSRRIRRPDPRQLNPFPDYDDPITLRFGNPKLLPEFINAVEAAYNKTWNAIGLNATLFYRFNQNPINRVIRTDSTGITRVSFANIDATNNGGTDFSIRISLSKKWNITINENLFYQQVKSTVDNKLFTNDGVISNLKINGNWFITPKWSIQLNTNFNSRVFNAQGIISPINTGSLSTRYSLWKNKANITANYSDVLNSQFFKINLRGTNFISQNYRRRESRILFLTFTLNLGNDNSANEQKKKKQNQQRDENSGGMDGGF